jgi:hypothetical protein
MEIHDLKAERIEIRSFSNVGAVVNLKVRVAVQFCATGVFWPIVTIFE